MIPSVDQKLLADKDSALIVLLTPRAWLKESCLKELMIAANFFKNYIDTDLDIKSNVYDSIKFKCYVFTVFTSGVLFSNLSNHPDLAVL